MPWWMSGCKDVGGGAVVRRERSKSSTKYAGPVSGVVRGVCALLCVALLSRLDDLRRRARATAAVCLPSVT